MLINIIIIMLLCHFNTIIEVRRKIHDGLMHKNNVQKRKIRLELIRKKTDENAQNGKKKSEAEKQTEIIKRKKKMAFSHGKHTFFVQRPLTNTDRDLVIFNHFSFFYWSEV